MGVNVNGFSYFLMDQVLEKVDYKWDYENGIEVDFRNNITKKLEQSYINSNNKLKWYERLISKLNKMSIPNTIMSSILLFVVPLLMQSYSTNEILDSTKRTNTELVSAVNNILPEVVITPTEELPSVSELSIDQKGIDMLKKEEGLRLTAYDINDGMITIGYGHAEKKKKSSFKAGDTITEERAEDLLRQDLLNAENGVKRLFKQWEDKGIKRELTQNQYNALVSMAYNMGVGGLRRSKVIKYIKKNDYEKAAEAIKTERIKKKFPGLKKRRLREYNLFTAE